MALRFRFVRWRALTAVAVAAAASLGMQTASAASFTLSGSFARDDQIVLVPLDLSSADTVGVRSIGYAGGVNVFGGAVAAGGFDTMLALFDAGGALIAQSDDGDNVPTDPRTGLSSDAAFSLALQAGHYTLVLTQYDNFALGNLAAGFANVGTGNFTPRLSGSCSASAFCDWSGAARTANWTLNITGVSAVPEPSVAALLLAGLVAVGARRRRARQA